MYLARSLRRANALLQVATLRVLSCPDFGFAFSYVDSAFLVIPLWWLALGLLLAGRKTCRAD